MQSVPAALRLGDLLIQQPQPALKYRGVVLAGFLSAKLAAMNMQQIATNLNTMKITTLQVITPSSYEDWRMFCPVMAAVDQERSILESDTSVQSKYDNLKALASRCVQSKNYTRANQTYIKIRDLLHSSIRYAVRRGNWGRLPTLCTVTTSSSDGSGHRIVNHHVKQDSLHSNNLCRHEYSCTVCF